MADQIGYSLSDCNITIYSKGNTPEIWAGNMEGVWKRWFFEYKGSNGTAVATVIIAGVNW